MTAAMIQSPQTAAAYHLLIAAEFYGMGGTETQITNLCQLLRKHSVHVTIATRFANRSVPIVAKAEEFGVELIATPFVSQRNAFRLSTVWAHLVWPFRLRSDYDAIYTLGVTRFTGFLTGRLRAGGRLIWHPCGNPEHLRQRPPRSQYAKVNAIVAESPIHEAILRERFGEPIQIIQLPSLCNTFDQSPPTRARGEEEIRVAFLGRFDENKGVVRLLHIWPTLNIGPARLDLYGDGLLRSTLEETIRRNGLSNVRVHGGWSTREELRKILEETDLVVLPSASEGVPLVLIEAMSFGVPFVATNVGAIRWLAESNTDVRVVDSSDIPEAISEMVSRIRSDSSHRARLRQYVADRFGETVSDRWLSFMLSSNTPQRSSAARAANVSSHGSGTLSAW